MKYFSEDEKYINAECEICKKVVKIFKEDCIQTEDGYKVTTKLRCPCGRIFETILGNAESTHSYTSVSSTNLSSNSKASVTWGKKLAFGFGILFISALIAKSCNDAQNEMKVIDPNYGKSVDQIMSEIKDRDSKKSVWEQNQDFARELERIERAGQLDRMEEERQEINKYRKYKD